MSLVILNDELAQFVAQDVINSLTGKLCMELDKLRHGDSDARKVADICTEISNLARQVDEQVRKKNG